MTSSSFPSDEAGRLHWIDFARGLGITLVVFGHVWRGLWNGDVLQDESFFDRVDAAVYLFHMPLFFCLSGFTFGAADRRRGDGLQVYAALAWRCLYPLTLWTYLFILMRIAAGRLANTPMSLADLPLFPLPPLEFLWFLWAIFLVQIWMTAIHRLVGFGAAAIALGAAASLAGLIFLRSPLATPMIFELFAAAIRYAPYFLVGMLLAAAGPVLGPAIDARPRTAAAVSALGFILLLLSAEGIMRTGGIVRWIAGGVATGLFLLLCRRLDAALDRSVLKPLPAFLRRLGRASLAIYLAHVIPSAAFRIGVQQAGSADPALHVLGGTLVGLLGPLILLEVARRFGFHRLLGF